MPNYTSEEINAKVKVALDSETFIEQVKTTLLCVYELSALINELNTTHEEKTNEAVESINARIDEILAKKTELENNFNAMKTELENKGKKLYDDGVKYLDATKEFIEKENQNTKEQVDEYVKEIAALQEEFNQGYEHFKEMFGALQNFDEKSLRLLFEQLEAKQTEVVLLNTRLDTQKLEVEAKIQQIPEILAKFNAYEVDFVAIDEKVKLINAEIANRYTTAKIELDKISKQSEDILSDLAEQNERVENARKEVETAQGEITQLIRQTTTQITADKTEVANNKAQYATQHAQYIQQLTNNFNTLNNNYNNVKNAEKADIEKIKQEFNTLRNTHKGELNTITTTATTNINNLRTEAETHINNVKTQATTYIDQLFAQRKATAYEPQINQYLNTELAASKNKLKEEITAQATTEKQGLESTYNTKIQELTTQIENGKTQLKSNLTQHKEDLNTFLETKKNDLDLMQALQDKKDELVQELNALKDSILAEIQAAKNA